MKRTFEELREMGFSCTEAIEIMKHEGYTYSDLGYKMSEAYDFITDNMPDIALNDYDYLECELFL